MNKAVQKRFVSIFLIFVLASSFSGCAMPIKYSLRDAPNYSNSRFSDQNLVINKFEDVRDKTFQKLSLKNSLQGGAYSVFKDGGEWYINHDDRYKDKTVAPWITEIIGKHIAQTKLFKSIRIADNIQPGDQFLLKGKIQKFEGYKGRAITTEVGMFFGLIGMLLTSGEKSKYHGQTVLIEVTLTDLGTNQVVWKGTVDGSVEGNSYADPQGFSAYEYANQSLKKAVNNLIYDLASLS